MPVRQCVQCRCDGDQLVVGACGGGFNNDCPGGEFSLLECCNVPEFYYGHCEVGGCTAAAVCSAVCRCGAAAGGN